MPRSVERAYASLGAAVSLASLVAACGGTASAPTTAASADSQKAEATGSSNPWAACYSSFSPAGDARGDLARLVRDCGSTGGMRPITGIRLGKQSAQDPVDRFTFEVPATGKCYRVYAAAGAGVEDLDLLLRGSSGDSAPIGDVSHDSWPVLPPHEPACFASPGLYMLEVSVSRGAGEYALQVWGR